MAVLIIGGKAHRNLEVMHGREALEKWLPELCSLIGMHPVGEVHVELYTHWPNGAPSAVLFLEESAITVHTYPEGPYVELILHSCKSIPGEDEYGGPVTDAIVAQLSLDVRERHYLGKFNWKDLSKARC